MSEFSPVMALMREYGAPMTRDEYLRWSHLGKKGKVTPEEEAELPHRFAYPVVTHDTVPEQKLASKKDAGKGAPVNFSGAVFPNEDGIEPMLDTDQPQGAVPDVKLDKSLGGKAQMDISNPHPDMKYKIIPDPMVPREQ